MWEEVEVLKDHPDLGALARDLGFAQLVQRVAHLPVSDELAIHREASAVDLLEVVDAAKQCRLARPGRAEQDHHFAGHDLQSDALEHLQSAEALVHGLGLDHGLGHGHWGRRKENSPMRIRCSGVSASSRLAPRA